MAKKQKLSLEELLEQALVKDEDQPYRVLDNWVWVRLDYVAEYKKGPFGSAITKAIFVPKSVNTYKVYEQGNAIRKDKNYGSYYIDEDKYNTLKNFTVYPNDLIVSCAGTVGEIFQLPNNIESGIINQALMRVRVKEKINLKFYLLYFDESLKADMTGKSKGTAIKNIPPFSILKQLPFPLPPLPEQQRIVTLIESLFEKLNHAKELAQNALDSFENRKSAILHKAFNGELTGKWRKENKVNLDSWENNELKNIATIISGTNFKSEDFSQRNVISCVKITNVGVGYFDDENIDYLPSEFLLYYQKQIVKCNDVLIALTRPFINAGLKTCIYIKENESLLNQRVALIRGGNGQYIYYYLRTSIVLEYIKAKSKTTNQPNLSVKDLEKLPIPYPSIAEQQEIVRILDHLLENEEKAKELCNVIEKIDHIKKSILAKAFRGELGTNHPEEESALELLKEILQKNLDSKKD